jgi:hypothetical protein
LAENTGADDIGQAKTFNGGSLESNRKRLTIANSALGKFSFFVKTVVE